MQRVAYVLCLTLPFLASGCLASKERKVTGTVTWEGKPIEAGTINLIATDPNVPAVSGKIVDGKYEVTTLPGAKKVEVYASRAVGEVLPHMGMAQQEMYIPEEYNARSILEMEVSPTGENTFEFDLPKKPK